MKRSPLHVNKFFSQGLLTALIGIVGAAVLATMPVPALSATSSATNPRAQYARDVAHCRSLKPHSTERANCLSEASTRFSMTQPSKPQEAPEILARNALRRCETLPAAHKSDCIARMEHGTVSGSIAGGGVLRTLVTREPMVDPAALPPTAAGSAPAAMAPSAAGSAPAAAPVTQPSPPMPPQPSPIVPPPPAPVVPAPAPESPVVPPTPVPPMQPAG